MLEIKRSFFKFCFWVLGWKVVGHPPMIRKYMITVAPHTSGWDFLVGIAAKNIVRLEGHFLGKKSLFDLPIVGQVMRYCGDILSIAPLGPMLSIMLLNCFIKMKSL